MKVARRNTGYSSITLMSWLAPCGANTDDVSTVAIDTDSATKIQSQPSQEQEPSRPHSLRLSVAVSASLLSQGDSEPQQQDFFASVSGDASPTQQLFVGTKSQQQGDNAASAGATNIANTAKNAARFAKRRVQRCRIIKKSKLSVLNALVEDQLRRSFSVRLLSRHFK